MGREAGKREGAVIWFTGLSGSGKSTIADRVAEVLTARGQDVERLDGDHVREAFPQTGFSREERNLHIRRMGFVAGLLEKHGVIVVASFISPYRESRAYARSRCRRFIEVYVSTPLAECERRDVKGLYKKARSGELKNFTGIDSPYEAPVNPEVRIDTTTMTPEAAASLIVDTLLGDA